MISENIATIVLNYASEIWTGKWRCAIRYQLKDGPKRFSEIKKTLPGCSVKVLTSVLKEMEENRIIIRKQYNNSIPVKVTYELTESAKLIVDILRNYISVSAIHMIAHQQALHISDDTINRIYEELGPQLDVCFKKLSNNLVTQSTTG